MFWMHTWAWQVHELSLEISLSYIKILAAAGLDGEQAMDASPRNKKCSSHEIKLPARHQIKLFTSHKKYMNA